VSGFAEDSIISGGGSLSHRLSGAFYLAVLVENAGGTKPLAIRLALVSKKGPQRKDHRHGPHETMSVIDLDTDAASTGFQVGP